MSNEIIKESSPSDITGLAKAFDLYEKVKSLVQVPGPLGEERARIIIELADDAIKEFGNTNQDKKIELREIKVQAEKALPPITIEDLKKRAEAHLIRKIFPQGRTFRSALLIMTVLGLIVIPFSSALLEFIKKQIPTTAINSQTYNQPSLEAELHSKYDGFSIRVINKGNSLAKGVYVDVTSWGMARLQQN